MSLPRDVAHEPARDALFLHPRSTVTQIGVESVVTCYGSMRANCKDTSARVREEYVVTTRKACYT